MDVVKYNSDVLFEILMRVDPCNIFNFMLVCKDWLQLITGWNFGIKYLNKWNGKLLVGLMIYTEIGNPPGASMMLTTNLGRQLNDNTALMPATAHIGKFICKSPNSSHMLFASGATTLYVRTGGLDIGSPLPPPPVYFKTFMANIICNDANFYTVILAEAHLGKLENTVNVQTFSSSTGQWEQSTLTCTTSLSLNTHEIGSGTVTKDCSVVYWRAKTKLFIPCLAAWDMNAGRSISLILEPLPESSLLRIQFNEGMQITWNDLLPYDFNTYYGVSPDGVLLSATCTFNHKDWDSLRIKIFTFDENARDWIMMYNVRHGSIWTKNLALLSRLFETKPRYGFVFVSFLPGILDSILIRMDEYIFVYHLESQKLEHLEYDYHNYDGKLHSNVINYCPLTMLDLRVWPSSHTLHLNHQY